MTRHAPTPPPEIVIRRADKYLGDYRVLDDVSVTLPAGLTTVVVTPFGMGATTLLQALLGLTALDGGDVTVGDLLVTGARTAQIETLRRRCGVLMLGGKPYGASGRSDRTVVASLRGALVDADRDDRHLDDRHLDDRHLDDRHLEDVLATFGLTGVAQTVVSALPRVVARRVALAHTVVAGPSLVVLDQPDAGLGAEEVDEIVDGLRRLRATVDATLVVATADLRLASALADRVVVLGRGAVVAAGAPADVLVPGETLPVLTARLGVAGVDESILGRRLARRSAASEHSLRVIKEERQDRLQGELLGALCMLLFLVGLILAAPYMPW